MAAFDPSKGGGMGGGVDLDDILQQMFGMGMGGGMPPGFGDGQPKKPRKGPNEEQRYEVTLEELYKGKTVKFASTKNIICSHCKGTGGKEKAKPETCQKCKGQGITVGLRSVGPGLVTQERLICDHCSGSGKFFKDKDKCKKCKGKQTTSEKKVLELYIPRGAREGERITLEGEADQVPDQIPGDIVFTLVEEDHEIFQLSHPRGKVLTPGQILRVEGEGMPLKKSDQKGDLFLIVKIDFPENGWIQDDDAYETLKKILPGPETAITATEVDEVEYESDADIEEVSYTILSSRFNTNQLSSEPIPEILALVADGWMKTPMRLKAGHSVLNSNGLKDRRHREDV
jgi:DnaJ family protein A protein 2